MCCCVVRRDEVPWLNHSTFPLSPSRTDFPERDSLRRHSMTGFPDILSGKHQKFLARRGGILSVLSAPHGLPRRRITGGLV